MASQRREKVKMPGVPGPDHCLRSISEMACEFERACLDAVIATDSRGTITFCNEAAGRLLGLAPAEAVGHAFDSLLEGGPREAKRIAGRLRRNGQVRNYTTRLLSAGGPVTPVSLSLSSIRNSAGRISGILGIAHDLSEIRRLEDELSTKGNMERQFAHAEHLATLGQLSAGLAHEIKNPLAGIKGAIDVIRDSIPSSDVHREILGDVLHEVDRIDKIVRDLLNYAKPRPPSHSDINLAELVQRIVDMVRKSSKNLSISLRQLNRIPGFTGDETQLEQVILNLLLNARQAMPAGGHIDIRLSHERETAAVRIEVADDGPGIPEEVRKKLFQPFVTTRTDGTGLGLATCLKNVQYHGGAIEVVTGTGQGTTFRITLPLVCSL